MPDQTIQEEPTTTPQAEQVIADFIESTAPKAEITPEQHKEPVRIGRPPKYKNPEELIKKIEEYFDHGIPSIQIVVGKGKNQQVIDKPVPTISGLSFFLGFADRMSMFEYKQKPKFTYVIKRAINAIERHYEEQLQGGVVIGSIFWLKVHGWQDRAPLEAADLDEFGQLMKAVQNRAAGLPIIEATNQLLEPTSTVEVTTPDDAETQKGAEITGVVENNGQNKQDNSYPSGGFNVS